MSSDESRPSGAQVRTAAGGNAAAVDDLDTAQSQLVASSGEVEAIADTAAASDWSGGGASSTVIDTLAVDLSAASPAGEAPTAVRPAEPPAATAPAAPVRAEAAAPQPARRRVQLNPVGAVTARPRPALGLTTPAAPAPDRGVSAQTTAPQAKVAPSPADRSQDLGESTATSPGPISVSGEGPKPPSPTATVVAEDPLATATFGSATPVEIPPGEELDADLEAEIAAAMTDERLSAPAEAFPIGLPGEEAEGEAAPPASLEELQRGTRLTGKIVALRSDDVFFDLGLRAPGVVSKRQFESGKPPEVGQQLVVVVDRVDAAEGLIHLNLPRGRRRISGNWEALTKGAVVDCIVTGTNKGGLQVTVSNLRGFLPASQVDVRFISELEPYIGQKLAVEVVEVNPKKRNLVVSRRAVIERERQEAEANLWQTLALGQTYRGTVKTVKDYGAFIDIGGVDAFLHVGEMSWNRIRHPEEVLSEGQEVEVQVISLDPERKRIGLGMKQLIKNPWQAATETYAPGSTVSGKVTRTAAFGAFIELEEGVEGLVHISELDHARVKRVTDVLREGQQVDVQVLEVDPERRRISLSLKALKEKQAEQAPAEEEPPPEQPQRRRRTPLKGGTGTSQAGGGLFGDPNRFK